MTRLLGRPGSPGVLLLCLDALSVRPDNDSCADESPGDWSANAARLLAHARAEGWSVGHVISRRPRPGEALWRSVSGLAPAPSEAVYHREQPSAFSSAELSTAVAGARAEVVLCGLSVSRSCLATALDAVNLRLPLTVAADAAWLSASERAGLDSLIRLERLGLAQCGVRLAATETLVRPWRRLRLLQGGRA